MLRITPLNDEKVNEGSWTNYMGVELCIARANNDRFLRAFKRITRPHVREMRNGTLDPQKDKELVAEAMAEAILVDWKPFTPAGAEEPLPYSKEAAMSLLINDRDCREFVSSYSQDLRNYLQEQDEDLEGN